MFLEELERDPSKYIPEVTDHHLSEEVVKVICLQSAHYLNIRIQFIYSLVRTYACIGVLTSSDGVILFTCVL